MQSMSGDREPFYILPVEHVGIAVVDEAGYLDVGGVKVHVGRWGHSGQGIAVCVRRSSDDLSVMEVVMARHDGLAQEELDAQNEAAANYPLGAKEYWRGEMVGKWTMGSDGHVMTDEDFEEEWDEGCFEEEPD